MLKELNVIEIQLLKKQGKKLKQIARETGHSINTIRKYVKYSGDVQYSPRPTKVSKLEPYNDYIQRRIQEAQPAWIPATVLFLEIRSNGYNGSLSLLRNYLHILKPISESRPIIRFETNPGEQMQVDFGHFKFQNQKFYAFTAILGYSRMLYAEFVTNQTVETVIKCHENAFNYFNGIPKYGLYDNMKSVIIKRNAYGEGKHKLQDCFYDFSKHYGIIPKFCKPYSPQTKGKIERMISYLRHCFYTPFVAGKSLININILNNAVMDWLNNVANRRVHATTKQIPFDVWQIEQTVLGKVHTNYTMSYGEQNKHKEHRKFIEDVIQQNHHILQHDLSIYESLLAGVPGL